jgi:phage terminase large subunit-like protein
VSIDLETWRRHEARIDGEQVPDGVPLLDRLPREFVAGLEPREALALRYEPRAYLRPRQIIDDAGDWLAAVYMGGRGTGKSFAAAAWTATQIQRGGDYALVAPTMREAWDLCWRVIRDECLPPWVRYVERTSHERIDFPDHGARLLMHSAEITQYRGPNLRGAYVEEPVRFQNGGELWSTLRLALRVRGATPPRAVFATTPPRELGWILDLCAEPTTRVIRGRMRDNPTLDPRAVKAAYAAMAGTIESRRELDGEVVLGADGALFRVEDIERHRVRPDEVPALGAVVVACDPAQSNKRDADPVGLVAVGIADGHLYVLDSCSERLDPAAWSQRAVDWADKYDAGRFVVEPTGSGSYPRATLDFQMRATRTRMIPIVESEARGSKADRAQPLSAAAAQGRLHLVGRHDALERELTTWHTGANWSPGGLDALVHGAAVLTFNWRSNLL